MFANILAFIDNHWLLTMGFSLSFAIAGLLEITKGGPKMSVAELVNLINRDRALVVDVRQPKDFDQGHISGAINIPHTKVFENISLLENKGLTPVLVCETGMSTSGIAERLRDKNIPAQRLAGGLAEWRAANIPLEIKRQSKKAKANQTTTKRKKKMHQQ